MTERMSFITVSRWRTLAQKRRAHLAELQRTGRWRRLFTSEAALEEALAAAHADEERWRRIAYSQPRYLEAAE
jgi:hypothetical protein